MLLAAGASDVKGILHATAEDLGDPGWDEYFGYGLVDAEAAALGSSLAPSRYTVSPSGKLSVI